MDSIFPDLKIPFIKNIISKRRLSFVEFHFRIYGKLLYVVGNENKTKKPLLLRSFIIIRRVYAWLPPTTARYPHHAASQLPNSTSGPVGTDTRLIRFVTVRQTTRYVRAP